MTQLQQALLRYEYDCQETDRQTRRRLHISACSSSQPNFAATKLALASAQGRGNPLKTKKGPRDCDIDVVPSLLSLYREAPI